MAERGKPLTFSVREQIKELRREATVREVAKTVNVSKTTVQKYSGSLVQNHSHGTDNR